MSHRRINGCLLMGLIGVFAIGSSLFTHVYSAFWGERDIWWTPKSMALPLEETGDRFQMYIGGKRLKERLADGSLFAVDPNSGQYRVVFKDVSVRVNNWDQVRASRLTFALLSSFGFGVSLTLLITGLVQMVRQR